VRELRPGLWHWQAAHPDWSGEAQWEREVSSYAIEVDGRLLLFDPIGVPDELLGRAEAIVLTAPWHERDTRALVAAHGLPVYAARPETAEELMANYGITAEQAGDGSPDLDWLRAGAGEAHWIAPGERYLGIEAFPGRERMDLVLWIESHRAVVAGDTLADFGDGIAIQPEWLRAGQTREEVAAQLRPLLAYDVELLLPAHGAPTDRAALERALA
jgi:glyoxylase-like metal-dependent hydrolase (beta-lactamase superfamily II)